MISFYYGAGSPYTWRVWLALEHKSLAYELKVLSFSAGDLRKPEFVALNPRHKVPLITDAGGLVLYESAAIVEYLQDAYPGSGKPLFPASAPERALVRRMVCEADNYFAPAMNRLTRQVLFTPEAEWNAEKIASAGAQCVEELELWSAQVRGDFLAGALSAADFTLYPMVALALRCEKKKPDLGLAAAIPGRVRDWMRGVERLPYFDKTWPAHWK